MKSGKDGFTLIEVIVVIAILGVLLLLLLPAIVQVRATALSLKCRNNMRQLVLATHHFAEVHQGRLPSINGDYGSLNYNRAMFPMLLDYLEQGAMRRAYEGRAFGFSRYRGFHCPSDPTTEEGMAARQAVSSYAANAKVFSAHGNVRNSISDGLSNTIGFAEHYAYLCGQDVFHFDRTFGSVNDRLASFANIGDVIPLTKGNPPVSRSSLKRPYTFQTVPPRNKCIGLLPQTPHYTGMVTGIMDGSIRVLSPNISNHVFWGAVTPGSGEVLSDW